MIVGPTLASNAPKCATGCYWHIGSCHCHSHWVFNPICVHHPEVLRFKLNLYKASNKCLAMLLEMVIIEFGYKSSLRLDDSVLVVRLVFNLVLVFMQF